jgi:PAS domain S-box-containing protein
MSKSPDRFLVYGVLSFLTGALLLAVLSIPQKMALGADAFALKGFIVPVFFGGSMGLLLGLAYKRLSLENRELKKLYEEARTRDLQYKSYFEYTHASMLLIDPGTAIIVDANPAACNFYGYDHDQITRMKITDINTLPHDEVHEEMELAKSQNRRYFNFKHRLANGDIRDVEVYSGPIKFRSRELLYSVVHDITERKLAETEREQLITQLQEALAEIKTLSGLLPICAHCKNIRDDSGYWQRIEEYIGEHSDAQFSHGICPECLQTHYPELNHEYD